MFMKEKKQQEEKNMEKSKNREKVEKGEYLHPLLPSKAQASITETILAVDPKEMLCKQVSRKRKGYAYTYVSFHFEQARKSFIPTLCRTCQLHIQKGGDQRYPIQLDIQFFEFYLFVLQICVSLANQNGLQN